MPNFHRLCMRDKLYNARRMIRQNSIDTKSLGFHQNNIYTNEYPSNIQWISTPTSTPLSRAQQRLFYKARKSKTTEVWKYAWTFHGQVFMRKTKSDDPVKITSELIKNPQRMMYGINSKLPQNNLIFRRMATGHRRVRKSLEFAPRSRRFGWRTHYHPKSEDWRL